MLCIAQHCCACLCIILHPFCIPPLLCRRAPQVRDRRSVPVRPGEAADPALQDLVLAPGHELQIPALVHRVATDHSLGFRFCEHGFHVRRRDLRHLREARPAHGLRRRVEPPLVVYDEDQSHDQGLGEQRQAVEVRRGDEALS